MLVPPHRILLVCLDAARRARLAEALGDVWEIEEGTDVDRALALARIRPPSLVAVCAEADGLRSLAALRTDPRTAHLPVLFLMEEDDPEAHAEAFRAGADAVVSVPVHPAWFRALAERIVQAREDLEERWSRQTALAPRWDAGGSEAAQFLDRVREVAEAGMALPEFAVGDLAQAVHLSARQLARRLKALTGETPGSLIRRLRMARADALLAEGWAVGEVAEAVGFRSPSQFRRAYREAHGTLPSARTRETNS